MCDLKTLRCLVRVGSWLLLFVIGAVEIGQLGASYRDRSTEARRAVLRSEFQNTTGILAERLEKFRFGLQGLAGLFHAEDYQPSLRKLRTYAASRQFYKNFEGAFGFGFIRVVPRSGLAAYERNQAKADPRFKIHGVPNSNYREGDNSYVIESIEPSERNRPAIGLDVSSERFRFEAALHAAKTGRTTLTRRISLVQKGSEGAGFLLFHPLYRTVITPDNEDSRMDSLIGWAYAPVLMKSLFESSEAEEKEELELMISEQESEAKIELFRSKNWQGGNEPSEFRSIVNAFERPWIIEARASHPLWKKEDAILTNAACLLGMLIWGALLYLVRRAIRFWGHAETRAKGLEISQQAIFENADFAIFTTSPSGLITSVNQSASRMFGFEENEVVGKVKISRFHERAEEDGETNFGSLLNKARGGAVYRGVWSCIRKDDTRFPGQLNLKEIADESGTVGFVAIIQDLTEKREAEAKMVHSAQMASLGEMSGGIAHEINNPLAMIKGKVSILLMHMEKGATDPIKTRADLEKINSVVDRIAAIVSGLRSFARDATHEGLKLADLSHVMNETAALCRERFQAHGVELRVIVDPDIFAECRPIQTSQALLNLLNNAHDAVVGGPAPWVEARLSCVGGVASFVVTDSGLGIAPEIAAKIMRPFFTTKDIGKGTGLGLSIAKGLVEGQGGKLYYDAESTQTRFVIQLPGAHQAPRKAA